MEIEAVALHNSTLQITGLIIHQDGKLIDYYGPIHLQNFPQLLERYHDNITDFVHEIWKAETKKNPGRLLFYWQDFTMKKLVKNE